MAPASTFTLSPAPSRMVPIANDGLAWMSTCIVVSPLCRPPDRGRSAERTRSGVRATREARPQPQLAQQRGQRQRAERQDPVVEVLQREVRALLRGGGLARALDLDHADHVRQRLARHRDVAVDLDHRVGVRHAGLLQRLDRGVARPPERVDAGVGDEAGRAVRLRVEHAEPLVVVDEQPHLVGEALAVQAPPLDERAAGEEPAEAPQRRPVGDLLLDRELEVMAGVRLVVARGGEVVQRPASAGRRRSRSRCRRASRRRWAADRTRTACRPRGTPPPGARRSCPTGRRPKNAGRRVPPAPHLLARDLEQGLARLGGVGARSRCAPPRPRPRARSPSARGDPPALLLDRREPLHADVVDLLRLERQRRPRQDLRRVHRVAVGQRRQADRLGGVRQVRRGAPSR